MYQLIHKLVILVFVNLLLASIASANVLQARLNKSAITSSDSVELILTLDSHQQTAEEPDLTELKKYFYIYGINKGSQIRVINGVGSAQQQWLITLVPKKTGQITIPAIRIGDQNTKPLSLTVNIRSKKNADLFILTSVSPKEPYMQSQIVYTVKILHDINLIQGQLTNPEADNVTVTRLGEDQMYTANYQGRSYHVIERRYALFAKDSGNIHIKPPLFVGQAVNTKHNQATAVQTVAPRLTLTVLPKPLNYTARNWLPSRDLSLNETWSSQLSDLKVGDAITRTISIKAKGLSAEQLPKFTPSSGAGINAYPDQPKLTNTLKGNTIIGQRIQTIAYIPTQAGELMIPAEEISWFDVTTKSMKTAMLPAHTMTILPMPGTVPVADKGSLPMTIQDRGHPWAWMAGLMALLWLMTLWVWLKPHHRKRVKTSKETVVLNKKQILSQLKMAHERDQYHEVRQLLLRLANEWLPNHSILSLAKLQALLADSEAKAALNKLEKQCFQRGDMSKPDWHSVKVIIHALKQTAVSSPSSKKAKRTTLPDLYRI